MKFSKMEIIFHWIQRILSITEELVTSMRTARLPRGQQVSHQRWIWGFHWTQAINHTSKGIHPGFQTQGRLHKKSKTGVSVVPQKELMSSKFFLHVGGDLEHENQHSWKTMCKCSVKGRANLTLLKTFFIAVYSFFNRALLKLEPNASTHILRQSFLADHTCFNLLLTVTTFSSWVYTWTIFISNEDENMNSSYFRQSFKLHWVPLTTSEKMFLLTVLAVSKLSVTSYNRENSFYICLIYISYN